MLGRFIAASLFAIILPLAAEAVPIGDVVIGGRYSLVGFGENRTGVVQRVDRSRERVLLLYDHNSRTEWVDASRLLATELESTASEVVEGVVIVAGVLCLLSEECRNGVSSGSSSRSRSSSSSSSRSSARSTAGASTSSRAAASTYGDVVIANNCPEAVQIRILYRTNADDWDTNDNRSWTVRGNGSTRLNLPGNQRLRAYDDDIFFYATSESYNWETSDEDRVFNHPGGRAYRRAAITVESDGDRRLSLTCNQ